MSLAALEGTAYLGIGIKGGFYERTDQGAWFLRTDFGRRPTPCPLDQTWPAAISVRDALKRRLDLSIFVVAILILPDMAGAPPIDQVAVNGKVSVLWGTENLVERMAETAKTKTINCPPTPVKSPGSWSSSCPGLAWLRSPSDPRGHGNRRPADDNSSRGHRERIYSRG